VYHNINIDNINIYEYIKKYNFNIILELLEKINIFIEKEPSKFDFL